MKRRTKRVIGISAVVGGVALLLWLLLGRGGNSSGGRVAVRIDGDGVLFPWSNIYVPFRAAVEELRTARVAMVDVTVAGNARYGEAQEFVALLQLEGIRVTVKGL